MPRFELFVAALFAVGCAENNPLVVPGGPDGAPAPTGTEPMVTDDEVAARSTVPLYGGTMAADDEHVVVADPGLDRVFVVSAEDPSSSSAVAFTAHAEPFRVAIDEQAFVTLRGTGRVARIDLDTLALVEADVCAEPRGVAAGFTEVVVACASGEVVVLDRELEVLRSASFPDDLRDVVIEDGVLWVSTFREAQVLRLDRATLELQRRTAPDMSMTDQPQMQPRTAWRMRAHPEGGVLVLHQGSTTEPIVLEPGDPTDPRTDPDGGENPYGGNTCDPGRATSSTHFTRVFGDDVVTGGALFSSGPRYDFSVGDFELRIANGGLPFRDAFGPGGGGFTTAVPIERATAGPECVFDEPSFGVSESAVVSAVESVSPFVQWVYARDGAQLSRNLDPPTELAVSAAVPAAFDLFHQPASSGLACATCHPEGQDDGHVWNFEQLGPRRTQNIAGGVSERAPFHWDGEFADLDELMSDVFVGRMGGQDVPTDEVDELAEWMDGVPPLRSAPGPAAQVEAGRALFESPQAACVGCHRGSQLTDSQLHVVREGDIATKTPSLLGVGARGPWMHDGCAETLEQRFTVDSCGGGDEHGVTSHFTDDDVAAIVAFLRSL